MPDIQLRFHRDMLVLSAPIDALLARQGVDAALDRQYLQQDLQYLLLQRQILLQYLFNPPVNIFHHKIHGVDEQLILVRKVVSQGAQ